jgi:hypothetical protein
MGQIGDVHRCDSGFDGCGGAWMSTGGWLMVELRKQVEPRVLPKEDFPGLDLP